MTVVHDEFWGMGRAGVSGGGGGGGRCAEDEVECVCWGEFER